MVGIAFHALRGHYAGYAAIRPRSASASMWRGISLLAAMPTGVPASRWIGRRSLRQIRFDDVVAGDLDAYWVSHGLSARITTSCSSRRPGGGRPAASSQLARAVRTAPNGIHCEETDCACKPVALNVSSDPFTSAKADCTNSMVPPAHSRLDAVSHSGSSTWRPSTLPFHAHGGPAVDAIFGVSSVGGAGA